MGLFLLVNVIPQFTDCFPWNCIKYFSKRIAFRKNSIHFLLNSSLTYTGHLLYWNLPCLESWAEKRTLLQWANLDLHYLFLCYINMWRQHVYWVCSAQFVHFNRLHKSFAVIEILLPNRILHLYHYKKIQFHNK